DGTVLKKNDYQVVVSVQRRARANKPKALSARGVRTTERIVKGSESSYPSPEKSGHTTPRLKRA
ncbi:MAG: hypothetical protein WCE62_16220, partial [Polyangiales bacterium]